MKLARRFARRVQNCLLHPLNVHLHSILLPLVRTIVRSIPVIFARSFPASEDRDRAFLSSVLFEFFRSATAVSGNAQYAAHELTRRGDSGRILEGTIDVGIKHGPLFDRIFV